jgi:hypothetical protein
MWWLYIILSFFAIIGWIGYIFWYKKAKEKDSNFWKITIAEVIELLMVGAVAWSVFIMREQSTVMKEQSNAMSEQSKTMSEQSKAMSEQSILIRQGNEQQRKYNINTLRPWVYINPTDEIKIDNTIFNLSFSVNNVGYTPAFNVRACASITNNINYPSAHFRKILPSKTPFFIFPNQMSASNSITFDARTLNEKIQSQTNLIEYIQKEKSIHTYIP